MDSGQKVAVITGALQGIGASLVAGFREIGYAVVANSRSISASDVGQNPSVLAFDGDIGVPGTAGRIVEAAMKRFGRIDMLVNNAGILIFKPFLAYDATDFRAMVAVNLAGFFHLTQRVVTEMVRAGSGHAVTITAASAEQPMAAVPATLTSLTKGGLNTATCSLAIEYASQSIRINAVSPGVIRTPMHPAGAHGFLAGLHPMSRMREAREVADAVFYLETAGFVTGEILHVDGGARAGHWRPVYIVTISKESPDV